MDCLQLRPFERHHLPLVEPWFTDGDTRRWLGGPAWPRQMLDLADRPLGEFRGAAETGRYRWLAWDQGTAVGYIDCGTYDRWATWEGGPGGRGVIVAPRAGLGGHRLLRSAHASRRSRKTEGAPSAAALISSVTLGSVPRSSRSA